MNSCQRKRTLRERIYEEVVHLILSSELPSGGWVDEKQVAHKLRVSQTPFREALEILAKGGLAAFMCAAFLAPRQRTYMSYPLENPIIYIG
jgi:DNA-binding GntR family transcriptional regulator